MPGNSALTLSVACASDLPAIEQFYRLLGFKVIKHGQSDKEGLDAEQLIMCEFGRDVTLRFRVAEHDLAEESNAPHQLKQQQDPMEHPAIRLSLFGCNVNALEKTLAEEGIEYGRSSNALATEACLSVVDKYTGLILSFSSKSNAIGSTALNMESEPASTTTQQQPHPARAAAEPKKKAIAFLTSGGDSPGMNAAIRAIVRVAIYHSLIPYAIYEGYNGLVHGGDLIKEFGWNDVAQIVGEGGTIIKTSRCMEFREREGRRKAVKNLVERKVGRLIVIGGDGSLMGADVLKQEWPELLDELFQAGEISKAQFETSQEFMVVGMVGSIDNDMCGTELTIGANTALHRIVEAVDAIVTTAGSHHRAFVVETMGRRCGWLALMASLAIGPDWVIVPEKPMDEGWEERMCDWLVSCRANGKTTTIVVIAEGAIDREGQPITSDYVMQVIVEKMGIEARRTILGHLQRGGIPSAFDRVLATLQGVKAVEAALHEDPKTSLLIGWNENKVTKKPLMECVKQTREVGKALRECRFEDAFRLRDPDFQASYSLISQLRVGLVETPKHPMTPSSPSKAIRFALINVGAPCCGMNAASWAVVQYCLYKGYIPIGIHNSFEGLVRGESIEMGWRDIEGWIGKAGSALGTNRTLPEDVDIGMVAYWLQRLEIRGIVIIGGFEAFTALLQLTKARTTYPAFCIPMVVLPATISNNVPGTEFSIGSDTALNAIVTACDCAKESASSSRKRVFVIEVQGGECGYLATVAGIAAAATNSYIPEEGLALADLQRDVDHLRRRFKDDRKQGRLILRNEKSSDVYTAEIISKIFEDEGGETFDSRWLILGHLQQGGRPSPLDRIRGMRLAVFCVNFLESWHFGDNCLILSPVKQYYHWPSNIATRANLENSVVEEESASVIGIRGPHVVFTPLNELAKNETNLQMRRPKEQWWMRLRPMARILAKYGMPPELC